MMNEDFPVYLFTGFLESGKSKFIQETLEDKRFCKGERTLLIVCEEGIEEYVPDQFADNRVFVKVINDVSEITQQNLLAFKNETNAERCIIEYNGMWLLDNLYNALPSNWMVYQEFMFADARNFVSYNANMRQLCFDKLKSCELVVFNRYNDSIDKMSLHKIVRGVSKRADIAYENDKGDVEYDDIKDPLPFDINASIIDIKDDDYAIWYRDLSEEGNKYDGKTVRFLCKAINRKKIPEGCIVVGRSVMTCCVEDIQFAGLVCQLPRDNSVLIEDDSWIVITSKIEFKFHKAYNKKGPVLNYISHELSKPPEQEVTTFY